MKTNKVYAIAMHQQRGVLFNSKLFVAALILALLVALFPAWPTGMPLAGYKARTVPRSPR